MNLFMDHNFASVLIAKRCLAHSQRQCKHFSEIDVCHHGDGINALLKNIISNVFL